MAGWEFTDPAVKRKGKKKGRNIKEKFEREVKPPVQARNEVQKEFLRALSKYEVIVFSAPSGVGKSYLTMCEVSDWLKKGRVDKIVLTRPSIPMGRSIGLVPGDVREKFELYLQPLLQVLWARYGKSYYENCLNSGAIELLPAEYARGRSINGVVILDECFEGSTEVLTKDGWTRFDELSDGGSVLQVNKDMTSEFVVPSRIIRKDYVGEMVTHSRSRMSMTATENHDLVTMSKKTGEIKKEAFKNTIKTGRVVPISTKLTHNPADFSWRVVLDTALQADGSYNTTSAGGTRSPYWEIQLSREDKLSRFREALGNLGIRYSEYLPDSRGRVRFYIPDYSPKYFSD